MKKILVLDTGKEWGGGTNSLIELLKRADRARFAFSVLFYDNYKKGADSDIKTEIERLGPRLSFLRAAHRGGTESGARGGKGGVLFKRNA